jgi:hypothetical protein
MKSKNKQRFIKMADSGQATIEFALTMILFFSFFLFFLQLSLVMAYGNFVHYATFMSARAYLSAGPDQEDQQKRARDVIVQMLKKSAGASGVERFPFIAKGVGGTDPGGFEIMENGQGQSWLTGVRYTFKSKLMMIPMGGTRSSKGAINSVTLTSESFLGREPTTAECLEYLRKFGQGVLYDNGC